MPLVTHTIEDTADPLKKIVVLSLGEDLSKSDFRSVQNIIHEFGKVNDCIIAKIRKGPKSLVIEILTKTRLGDEMNNSPFESDKLDEEKV
jgi:hypothetical protein